MSEILSNVVVVIMVLAAFAALARWVRRDTFSGTPTASAIADAAGRRQLTLTRLQEPGVTSS